MKLEKFDFRNKDGKSLSAKIDFPDGKPKAFALFAHCFTCDKNYTAIATISKAMTSRGFAVMRFDFTGLGESEGDFAETHFSSNVDDLIAAAEFLETKYSAPALLVGHSLGGAAAAFAAGRLPSIKAVALIASPSSLDHLKNILLDKAERIVEQGYATVNIGGRNFTIKKSLIDDLEKNNLQKALSEMGKALIILHSADDRITPIKAATEIYMSAKRPKSFVSLDGADHLLSDRNDSTYAGEVVAVWSGRYIDFEQ